MSVMSTKWLAISSLLLVSVALAGGDQVDREEKEQHKLERTFDRLDDYLTIHWQLDEAGLAKLAKSTRIGVPLIGDAYLRRAAKIFAYLNEFGSCDKKAIEYMYYVMVGRPNAQPGREVRGGPAFQVIEKTRLDHLLGAVLVRAAGKCKSFLKSWYEQSERAIEPASKQRLYRLVWDGMANVSPSEVVDAARNDASVSKQLAESHSDEQLHRFYRAYLEDNLEKPCKMYMKAMGEVMSRAKELVPSNALYPKLFERPSEDYADSLARYEECSDEYKRTPHHVQYFAGQAVAYHKRLNRM